MKNAAAGVPQGMKRTKLTHDIFRDVHDRKIESINVGNGRIESRLNKLFTNINEKPALSSLDKKGNGRM